MKTVILVGVILISGVMSSAEMTRTTQLKTIAELPGSSLKWIHAAETEFKKRELDVDRYRVIVVEEKDSVTVMLQGLHVPRDTFGSIGPYPGYEVEISKKDLKVVSSHYTR